ncbi:alkaline D-peptidase [Aspergillus flavus AF70]|nr:alkaline D-peptidase [Aspergillus flavus AF70]
MPLSSTCQNCAKSKVRCVRNSEESDICSRCARLNKQCVYRETGRRFKGFKKDRQIEALESKINELMANCESTSTKQTTPGNATYNSNDEEADQATMDVVARGYLSMEAAQSFIDIYRTDMTLHFPFVVIPPQVTATDLRQQKPFLFLAVLASAAYSNMPLQRLLGREFKKIIASRMITSGEVSFELLQGMLVFLAWSHYHSRPHRYTQFLQLAIGLMVELRLDRPPQTKTWKTALKFNKEYTLDDEQYIRPSWGLDEQRAVVGCYYLSSTISILLHKPSCFPDIAPYLEQCCQSLDNEGTTSHDTYILPLFHLQVIAEKIDNLSWKHGMEVGSTGSAAELYVSNIKADLDRLRSQLPVGFFETPVMAMQLYTTELFSETWWDEIFCSGLTAAENILNMYMELPPGGEQTFNNTQWVQMAFCILVASRQVVAASRMGKAALVPQIHAWPETLEKLRQRLGALSTTQVDLNGDRDVFVDFENRVSRIQGWFNRNFGPPFPAFTLDKNSSILTSALANLTGTFDEQNTKGSGSHGITTPNTTSFSVSLFSTNQGTASASPFFFDYHYTAPSLQNSSNKIQHANRDSIYRIGGLTQIFTVWTSLVEAGDAIWHDPVTKYLPELATITKTANAKQDPVRYVDWEDITVGQLASHMAGLSRDYCVDGIGKEGYGIDDGLPPSNGSSGTCRANNSSQAGSLAVLAQQLPVAPPGVTPIYSNVGFQILGYIIERITGQPFSDVLESRILKPLSLTKTSLHTPLSSSSGLIPTNPRTSGWSNQYTGEAPALSMYSTITDLSTAGKAILNSTILPRTQTNRWLKPVSHTSNPANSLGYPWIVYSSGDYPSTSMVDIYTYYSSIGQYSSYIGLVPDYNVGFTVLAADSVSAPDLNAHADIIGDVILPALMKTAVTQAGARFGGQYTAASGLNSSITVSVDELPGMFVDKFVSNGTDFRKTLASLIGVEDPEALSIRLYPTGLVSETASGGSRVSFRAVLQDKNELADADTPTCVSWMDVDKFKYQGRALDLFVFEVHADGNAVGVEIPGLELHLNRKK